MNILYSEPWQLLSKQFLFCLLVLCVKSVISEIWFSQISFVFMRNSQQFRRWFLMNLDISVEERLLVFLSFIEFLLAVYMAIRTTDFFLLVTFEVLHMFPLPQRPEVSVRKKWLTPFYDKGGVT